MNLCFGRESSLRQPKQSCAGNYKRAVRELLPEWGGQRQNSGPCPVCGATECQNPSLVPFFIQMNDTGFSLTRGIVQSIQFFCLWLNFSTKPGLQGASRHLLGC